MRLLILPVLVILAFSCTVSEKNIIGTYRLRASSQTRLVLNDNKTFEFVKNFNAPGPVFFPDSTELNFRTAGNWKLENGQLILTSFAGNEGSFTGIAKDSVTKNTDITSFSFWDPYGEPVDIRMIRFPENRTKLHKSNVVSFFAEDFISTDTLEFHFYGYRPYRWINPPSHVKGNNQHRITLFEQDRPGYFQNVVLHTERKKISSPDRSFTLFKSE